MEIVRLSGVFHWYSESLWSLWELKIKMFIYSFKRHVLDGNDQEVYFYASLNNIKHLLLVFKQPPFYDKWYFITEPFRMTCQLKRKQLPWEYQQWKRFLLLMWWRKTAVILIVKRNVKYPCWYLRRQIRYISKFFSSLKDPESLTIFKPFASRVLIFGTSLFLEELRCFDIAFGRPYRCFSITLKVILSLFDLQNFLLLSKGIC